MVSWHSALGPEENLLPTKDGRSQGSMGEQHIRGKEVDVAGGRGGKHSLETRASIGFTYTRRQKILLQKADGTLSLEKEESRCVCNVV